MKYLLSLLRKLFNTHYCDRCGYTQLKVLPIGDRFDECKIILCELCIEELQLQAYIMKDPKIAKKMAKADVKAAKDKAKAKCAKCGGKFKK